MSQNTTAISVVQAQVDAFNVQDLEAFLATYAPDAVVVGVTPEPMAGADELREFYTPRLTDPTLNCVLDSVVTFGDRWVVAHESITTSVSSSIAIATFDVVDGLISRASMLKA